MAEHHHISTQPSALNETTTTWGRYLLLVLCVLVATTWLRMLNLDADPAPWFTEEFGYQIDEGYKTLSPRNLSLFGDTHWNRADQYRGWMTASAITQWPYYWAFETFGLELRSARIISIIYAITFLVLAGLFLRRRLSSWLALGGVILLASDPALFLFSRSALFETSMTLFLYTGLFCAVLLPERYRAYSIMPVIAVAIPAMFYIKLTAIVYMAPVIFALALTYLHERLGNSLNIRKYGLALPVILGLAVAVLYFNQSVWIHKLNIIGVLTTPQLLVANTTHTLSPLALIMAYLVLLEMLIRQPDALLKDGYWLSLAAIVILVPVILSLFFYNPTRYYVPIVPAALLLVVERLSFSYSQPATSKFRWLSIPGLLALYVFIALTMTLMATLNYYILKNIPFSLGADPGLSYPVLLKLLPLACAVFAAFAWVIARRYWKTINHSVFSGLAVLHILIGVGISITAVAYPDYESRAIRIQLRDIVGTEKSLGGDWAPFFIANTKMHAVYMRPDLNSVDRLKKLRPDYFLDSSTAYDKKILADLIEASTLFEKLTMGETVTPEELSNSKLSPQPYTYFGETISTFLLGKPVNLGEFRGNSITLYPLHYFDEQGDPIQPLSQFRRSQGKMVE